MINEWTDEQVRELRALLKRGYSMLNISKLMTEKFNREFTRSAIAGKKNRLGLSDNVSLRGTKRRTIRCKPESFSGGKTLANAENNDCRYMCLEHDNICGMPVYRKSLCEKHYDVCWVKRVKKTKGQDERK